MNKKFMIILITAILGVVSVASYMYFKSDDNKTQNIVKNDSNPRDVLDINPNAKENPVLYDFVNSSIGYKSDIKANSFSNSYLIMVRKDFVKGDKDSGTIHISRMNPQDFFPPITTGYISTELKGQQWDSAKMAFRSWPKSRKFDAVDYTLYVVADNAAGKWLDDVKSDGPNLYSYNSTEGATTWNKIDLNAIKYPEGRLMQNVRENGWSTEWLRKAPYRDQILDQYKTDVNDRFFDKFNLYQVFKLKGKNGDYDIRMVKVDGVNKFSTLNGPIWHMPLDQMNMQLEEEGYEKIQIK